jgi:hypothetical protein
MDKCQRDILAHRAGALGALAFIDVPPPAAPAGGASKTVPRCHEADVAALMGLIAAFTWGWGVIPGLLAVAYGVRAVRKIRASGWTLPGFWPAVLGAAGGTLGVAMAPLACLAVIHQISR